MIKTVNTNSIDPEKSELSAKIMIMASVFLFSCIPLGIALGNGDQAPFTHNAVAVFFARMGILSYILIYYKNQLFDRGAWVVIFNNCKNMKFAAMIFGTLSFGFFNMSCQFINISVSAILFETWTFWMIFITYKIFKKDNIYNKINMSEWFWILMGFAGLALVVFSQHEISFLNAEISNILIGITLASISAASAAMLGSYSLMWGTSVARQITGKKSNDTNYVMFFVLWGLILSSLPGITLGLLLGGFGPQNEIVEVKNMLVAAFTGFFIIPMAQILYRKANLMTVKLKINALYYLSPIVSVALLFAFGYVNADNLHLLFAGAFVTATSNIILNYRK